MKKIIFSSIKSNIFQVNPNLDGLFSGSFWGVWGVKLPPCLKLVRIMLETSNLARKYKYLISENIPFSTKVVLILLMSVFFLQKITVFWQK